jgi:hypothetical protein
MEVSVWPEGYIFSGRLSVIRATNCTPRGLLIIYENPTIWFLFYPMAEKMYAMFGLDPGQIAAALGGKIRFAG